MKLMKVCFRCKQVIEDKEHHFVFQEFNNERLIHTDYCHKKCWDDFLAKVGDTTEAMGVVRGLKKKLQEMGVLPEEVVEVSV